MFDKFYRLQTCLSHQFLGLFPIRPNQRFLKHLYYIKIKYTARNLQKFCEKNLIQMESANSANKSLKSILKLNL